MWKRCVKVKKQIDHNKKAKSLYWLRTGSELKLTGLTWPLCHYVWNCFIKFKGSIFYGFKKSCSCLNLVHFYYYCMNQWDIHPKHNKLLQTLNKLFCFSSTFSIGDPLHKINQMLKRLKGSKGCLHSHKGDSSWPDHKVRL